MSAFMLSYCLLLAMWATEALKLNTRHQYSLHHPSHHYSINHIDNSNSKEVESADIGAWPASEQMLSDSGSDEKQQYHWLDDDLVQKNRREPDGMIRLPGGCEMTPEQYDNLLQFRRDVDYVQSCYCQDGSVYCKLKKGGDHVHVTK